MFQAAIACGRIALISGTTVLVVVASAAGAVAVIAFLLLREINPPTTAFMLAQRLGGQSIEQQWVPLERISPNLIRAVVLSEDARFCVHGGVDFREMALAMEKAERNGGEVRGASTISMQVIKNLFLWEAQNYLRKGIEVAAAPLMEQIWTKNRILEVYLNIAEWAPGVFGAEAAAQHHFGKSARSLGAREAALLAASLPDPKGRQAGRPKRQLGRLAGRLENLMRRNAVSLRCLNVEAAGRRANRS